MLNRGDSSKSISTEYRDLGVDKTIVTPYEQGFRFSVTLLNGLSLPVLPDPRRFTLSFVEVSYDFNYVTHLYDKTAINLDYEVCDFEKEFGHIDKDFSNSGFTRMYCPKNSNYHVTGNVECKC